MNIIIFFMEIRYVQSIYNKIAVHFNVTRTYYSKQVLIFLKSLPKYTNLLEIGCGNGKHLLARNDIYSFGIDFSIEMCRLCQDKYLNICLANSLHLPFKNNYFDNSISIAMLHHLSSEQLRYNVLQELTRVTNVNGKILIQVWSTCYLDICKKNKYTLLGNNDYLIKWTLPNTNTYYNRFYHLFSKNDIVNLIATVTNLKIIEIILEYHNWIIICQKI